MGDRLRLYLDTSVISAYFDERTPDRVSATRAFWQSAQSDFEFTVSPLVVHELDRTPGEQRRKELLALILPLALVPSTSEAQHLADRILEANIVPENKPEDALRLAIAVERGLDALVSWNFRHMINFKTQRFLPVVCAKNGYFKSLQITSPLNF